jgi:hypothetical protein
MDHASQRMRAGLHLGAAALVAGTIIPLCTARAVMLTDGIDLFTAGLACGSADTPVETAKLLVRVRAEGAAPALGLPAARARAPESRRAQQTARPTKPPLSQRAQKNPQVEQELRGVVLRSFYTCNATPPPNGTEGTGWRLVGPLRHG